MQGEEKPQEVKGATNSQRVEKKNLLHQLNLLKTEKKGYESL